MTPEEKQVGEVRKSGSGWLEHLSTIVAVALAIFLLAFYFLTIQNGYEVKEQVDTIEAGPYRVSLEAGRVETGLVKLQTLAERPLYARTPEAINDVESAYAVVDEKISGSIDFIVSRHINEANRFDLAQGYDELVALQEEYIALCRDPEVSDEEVRAFAEGRIVPLINDLLKVEARIFEVSTGRVDELCGNVDSLVSQNVTMASVLMAAVLASLVLYLTLIYRQSKKEQILREKLGQALEMAQAASKAKSDFLSSMSHDIRTPMNAIVGLTAIAQRHTNDQSRVEECLERIAISSKHLLSLINDVLDMGKIESGKVVLSHEHFSFPDLIAGIVTIVQPQAKAKGLALDIHAGDVKQESVIGDPTRLEQVLLNLLSNAIKYTPEGGRVRLSISENEGASDDVRSYRFVVADTGIGMDSDFMDMVFEPFERERGKATDRTEGAGLGMAITKNIVDMMGGTVSVESTLGVGTTFTVELSLPCVPDQNDYSLLAQLQGKRALVVDDDVDILEGTRVILGDLGMDCGTASSGTEAIDLVVSAKQRGEGYHAVVVDWVMPDMDGVETIRRIRREVGKGTPILLLTAYDWTEIEDEAREAGANAFIAKPLFKSRLYHALSQLCLEDEIVEAECDSDAGKPGLEGRVLLVEDNELNRMIATELIEMEGATVEQACDGLEAVDMLLAAPDGYYGLVFMDMQMPRMDGIQATVTSLEQLAARNRPCPPIVAMTANAFSDDREAALAAGMHDFLTKPINLVELKDTLRKYLGSDR